MDKGCKQRIHIKDIEIKCSKRCLSLLIRKEMQTKTTFNIYFKKSIL